MSFSVTTIFQIILTWKMEFNSLQKNLSSVTSLTFKLAVELAIFYSFLVIILTCNIPCILKFVS